MCCFSCKDNATNLYQILERMDTNCQSYSGSADLAFILKPLHEFHYQDVTLIGVHFANSGAGAWVEFPSKKLGANGLYKSIGCDWASATNLVSDALQPILFNEKRQGCHPRGDLVPPREYNPLERSLCRTQAPNPEKSHNYGPYLYSFSKNGTVTTFGRATYDKIIKKVCRMHSSKW